MNLDYSEKDYSVMIADDNQNNLKVLSAMLESLGYRVRVSKTGEQALQSIAKLKPDIILLDIHMPGMDGYEACKRLKENEEYTDIPVIFISALSEVFNKIQAFNAGGVDYITKPFELEEVRLRIETHIKLKENTKRLQTALFDLQRKEEMLVQSEKMAALGILTSGIAHEINNPVNFISNSFYAIEDRIKFISSENKLPDQSMIDDFNNIFKNITKGIEHITKIIHGLRIYSRIDTDSKNNREMNDLNVIIETLIIIMNHRFTDSILIEKKFSEIPLINCQAGRISLAMINILTNSIDAIELSVNKKILNQGEGKIIISTECDSDHLIIKITDNGIGIEKSIVSKIFDPFFTTKIAGNGVGLGLSICKGIVRDHNGNIDVESVRNKGTVITISLPITEI